MYSYICIYVNFSLLVKEISTLNLHLDLTLAKLIAVSYGTSMRGFTYDPAPTIQVSPSSPVDPNIQGKTATVALSCANV